MSYTNPLVELQTLQVAKENQMKFHMLKCRICKCSWKAEGKKNSIKKLQKQGTFVLNVASVMLKVSFCLNKCRQDCFFVFEFFH